MNTQTEMDTRNHGVTETRRARLNALLTDCRDNARVLAERSLRHGRTRVARNWLRIARAFDAKLKLRGAA